MKLTVTSKRYGTKEVLIDDEDFDLVSEYKWKLKFKGGHFHVEGRISLTSGPLILMHRLLTHAGPSEVVDHVNGDGLDNRRNNLRICTRTQNNWNARKREKANSVYKGVTKTKSGWQARIQVNGTRFNLGVFKTETQAAMAYNIAAIKHFRQFAVLNIPGGTF